MSSITARCIPRLYWRFTASFVTQSKTVKIFLPKPTQHEQMKTSILKVTEEQRVKFEDLKIAVHESISTNSSIASKIKDAQNVYELLDLMKMSNLSKTDILSVMSTIINWVNKSNSTVTNSPNDEEVKHTDSTIDVTDNEIDDFSEYANLSTSAMISLVLDLAKHKKRNVKLLNFLFDNINRYSTILNTSQCSSLLFSMSTLCCFHEALLDKICSTLIKNVNKMTPPLNSIMKSMAILKYKNINFLNHICKLLSNSDNKVLHKHYLLNILHTFAVLNYETEETNMIIKRYLPDVSPSNLTPHAWLNLVWSLLVLNNLSNSHAESVLQNDFIANFESSDLTHLQKQIQLLNINGAAKYILQNYSGQLLDNSIVPNVTSPVTPQKVLYINALEETLKSFLEPSQFQMNVNTNMGFLLDAECLMDQNLKPVNESSTNIKKIAIVIHTYNNYCKGVKDLIGKIKLQNNLLSHRGYQVLNISYQHFSFQDKLHKRTEFLIQRIRSLK
ncbi:FAST kinase domain-containing protein 4 [Ptiloglossa arizonensis]|uniref:FAST kinase domain-containing protein 4 n=1 Tax=Ptiloglossa arizonensis TaxID=3350558 RepID=UPI003F9EC75E